MRFETIVSKLPIQGALVWTIRRGPILRLDGDEPKIMNSH